MNTLETHVLRLIGENLTSPDVFTDDDTGMAQIRTSLNDAIQDINMVTGGYSRRYWLSTVENRAFYRLSSETDHILYIKSAWDRENKIKLRQTDLTTLRKQDPEWLKHSGTPLAYCWIGWEYFVLYQVPTAKGRVIDLECVCVPKAYDSDKALVKIRERYHDGAVHYAVSEYFASRGDAARATEHITKGLEVTKLTALRPQSPERTWQFKKEGQQ